MHEDVIDMLLGAKEAVLIGVSSKKAKKIVDDLPEEVFNRTTKFLDPACRSGSILRQICLRLMKTEALIKEFPNIRERLSHIIHNQIYGITPEGTYWLLSIRSVCGEIREDSNIKLLDNYMEIVQEHGQEHAIKDVFGDMKFDVVIHSSMEKAKLFKY